MTKKNVIEVKKEFELGALISATKVWKLIGYPSYDAYRKARSRGTLPVKEITIEGRRGRFVLVTDLTNWLISLKNKNEDLKMK